MTTEQIEKYQNKKVKAFFGQKSDRFPIIGKFVKLKDHEELSSKGMVRFVSLSRFDFFKDENPDSCLGMTRIYVAKDFTQIVEIEG